MPKKKTRQRKSVAKRAAVATAKGKSQATAVNVNVKPAADARGMQRMPAPGVISIPMPFYTPQMIHAASARDSYRNHLPPAPGPLVSTAGTPQVQPASTRSSANSSMQASSYHSDPNNNSPMSLNSIAGIQANLTPVATSYSIRPPQPAPVPNGFARYAQQGNPFAAGVQHFRHGDNYPLRAKQKEHLREPWDGDGDDGASNRQKLAPVQEARLAQEVKLNLGLDDEEDNMQEDAGHLHLRQRVRQHQNAAPMGPALPPPAEAAEPQHDMRAIARHKAMRPNNFWLGPRPVNLHRQVALNLPVQIDAPPAAAAAAPQLDYLSHADRVHLSNVAAKAQLAADGLRDHALKERQDFEAAGEFEHQVQTGREEFERRFNAMHHQ